MSTSVNNSNSIVFGPQSPLYRSPTDAGLKEKLLRTLVNDSSEVSRKRAFAIYRLTQQAFPQNKFDVNENVRMGIVRLLEPFITSSNLNQNAFNGLSQRFSAGEVFLANELQKATGVKNLIVNIVARTKEQSSYCHGPITYILRHFKDSKIPIDPSWTNRFISFKNPESIAIIVAIPQQYIMHIVNTLNTTKTQSTPQYVDKVADAANMADQMTVDLVKSFFTAIYNDGARTRINADMLTVKELIELHGKDIETKNYESSRTDDEDAMVALYKDCANELKRFRSDENKEKLIISLLNHIMWANSCDINPYDFYKGLIEVPYVQLESTFSRCPVFQAFEKNLKHNYIKINLCNSLAEMDDILNAEDSKDFHIYAMKLCRFIPWLAFNTYVIGNGSNHTEFTTLKEHIMRFATGPLINYGASSAFARVFTNFLVEEITYVLEDFVKGISSPLSCTPKVRKVLTTAINRYQFRAEDEKNAMDAGDLVNGILSKFTNHDEGEDEDPRL